MISYIIENFKDKIPFIAGVSIFLIANIILFVANHYTKTISEFFFCKRRIRVTILSITTIVGFLVLLFFTSYIENWVIYLVAGCCAGLILMAWILLFCPSPLALLYLLRYRAKYKKGYLYEYADKLPNRLWCAFTVKDKYEYTVLCNKFFVNAGYFRKSIECTNKLSVKRLSTKESDVILRIKMLAFKMLGANGAALEQYQHIVDHNPTDQCLYGLIEEERGNISHSQEINRKLHDEQLSKNKKRYDQSIILNNYARSLYIKGNKVAAENLLTHAVKYAEDVKDYYNYVGISQNLIDILLQENKEKAIDFFKEYCEVLKAFPESKWRFLSFINPKLKLAEALNSLDDIKAVIGEATQHLSKLTVSDKINTLVTILNIMFRTNFMQDKIVKELYELSDEILSSPMPLRYRWAIDIIQKLYFLNMPYVHELFIKLDNYLTNHGYEDNSEYLDSLPEYMIYEKCSVMKEREFIKSIKAKNFLTYLESFQQVAELYRINGLYRNYWSTLLQILKESTYYKESSYDDKLKKIAETLDMSLQEHCDDISLADTYLGFAIYLYGIKDYNKAKIYLTFFENTKVTPIRLNTNLRSGYAMLKQHFNP